MRVFNSSSAGYRDLHLILYLARLSHNASHNSAVGSPWTNGQTNGARASTRKRENSFFLLLFPAGATADEWRKGRVVIRSAFTKTSNDRAQADVGERRH